MPNKAPSPRAWPVEPGKPRGEAIHATAVAISGVALLILGPSRSGKSRLAAALIAASTPRRRILLVGDDRILLSPSPAGDLVSRPHPRIAGFIERRGLGLVAIPFVASAPVGGLVSLGGPPDLVHWSTTSRAVVTENFPTLAYVESDEIDAEAVLGWWPRRFYNTGGEIVADSPAWE